MPENIEKILPLPETPCELWVPHITEILRAEIQKTGLTKAVLGVSGGIDSALSLAFAVKALGAENVTAYLMPYETSNRSSEDHGKLVCDHFNVKSEKIEVTPMANAYFSQISDLTNLQKGNVMARLRMIILYDRSSQNSALVVGTSNKTEGLLGYSTLWGDMASAVNPLGDLYKFQVRALSKFLGVPSELINKPPSADLWEGQTDEADLQMTYDIADRILYNWIDLARPRSEIAEKLRQCEHDPALVEKVFKRVSFSQFKRKMPVIAKVSRRTINREFRNPRDWGM